MKKSTLPIYSIILLITLFNNLFYLDLYSSSQDKDSQSAFYDKIPDNGIFDKWLLLGPIPVFVGKPNPQDILSQIKAFETDYIQPTEAMKSIKNQNLVINNFIYKWQYTKSDDGIIDLKKVIGDTSFVSAYAFAQINMTEDKEFMMGVGSDDAIKIWINGKLIHKNMTARGLSVDNDLVPIKLKKGKNEILVKVQNMVMGWGFTCRTILPSQCTQKLIECVKLGSVDNVNILLKNGGNINISSDEGLTLFQIARMYGHKDLAEYLKKKGADTSLQMPSKEKLVDNIFEKILKNNYPGAAVLISRDGKILYEKAYGYSNLEDEIPFKVDGKFRIASVTKEFTSAAILKLQEQGLLNVNDTVSKYLPEVPRGNEITIRQLLTHSSGLQRDWSEEFYKAIPIEFTKEFMLNEVKNLKYDFTPGERFGYSNSGYYILSHIVEKISGMGFNDFLKKSFFVPLGMINTGVYHWNTNLKYEALKNEVKGYCFENGMFYKAINLDEYDQGAGELYSTLEDLYRWNEALFNNKVLNEASLKAAFTPVEFPDPKWKILGFDYGFGFFIRQINGIKDICHSGGLLGYESQLSRLPEKKMNIIVFFNRFPFPQGTNAANTAEEITRIYLWEEMNKPEIISQVKK